ncbi:MAG: nuclear transport factor 2 family protein [Proteobacteria bacterium]|nr:nuclear transport factor 2 family protein [Pseudomonadota bacterium]
MNNNHKQTWDEYTESWKADNAQDKLHALNNCLDTNCQYNDPLIITKGHKQLLEYMQDFHKQIPGGHFITNYFLAHSNKSIAQWDMCDGGNNKIGEGISYGKYNSAGKLISVTGFFKSPFEA